LDLSIADRMAASIFAAMIEIKGDCGMAETLLRPLLHKRGSKENVSDASPDAAFTAERLRPAVRASSGLASLASGQSAWGYWS
jgi:hypothetical protein